MADAADPPLTPELVDTYASSRLSTGDTLLAGDGAGPLPVPSPAFAITAWNPMSEPCRPDANDAANRRLAAELAALPCTVLPAVGESTDGSWREEGFLVAGIGRDAVLALGRRFGQHAVYELTDDELLVVTCDDGTVVARTHRST